MGDAWYILLSAMLTTFTILEGWDFGAGSLHFIAARTHAERRQLMGAIQPLWTWNEVWLVASGGIMLMAFPRAMAVAFPAFYLAIYLLLWCILLRGVAIEFVGLLNERLWQSFWDTVFCMANVLLALLFGIALGNLVRGLPLTAEGNVAMSLFTDMSPYGAVGILDWYTISVGILALLMLMAHGASFLQVRTSGAVNARTRRLIPTLWILALICLAIVTYETWMIRPDLFRSAANRPIEWLCAGIFCVGLVILIKAFRAKRERMHFIGSVTIIGALMAGCFGALFPDLLHAIHAPQWSLTVANCISNAHGLALAIIWWPLAALTTCACAILIAVRTAGKVPAPDDATQGTQTGHGHG